MIYFNVYIYVYIYMFYLVYSCYWGLYIKKFSIISQYLFLGHREKSFEAKWLLNLPGTWGETIEELPLLAGSSQ